MAEVKRIAALAAIVFLVSGCTFYGGAATARLGGSTLETSSASASVGTGGVSTQSSRTVREIRPVY